MSDVTSSTDDAGVGHYADFHAVVEEARRALEEKGYSFDALALTCSYYKDNSPRRCGLIASGTKDEGLLVELLEEVTIALRDTLQGRPVYDSFGQRTRPLDWRG